MKPRFPTKLDDPTKISDFVTRHARETAAMLNNGLTLEDNVACSVIEVSLPHNTETLVANPLRGGGVPLGIVPIAIVEDVPTNLSSFMPAQLPSISWYRSPSDGLLRLRAHYPTEETVAVDASAAQNIAHATVTTLTFDSTAAYQRGNALAYNGIDRITASTAGRYQITAQAAINGGTAVYTRAMRVSINGTATFQIETAHAQAVNAWAMHLVAEASLSANDYVTLQAYQEDSGSVTRTTYSSANAQLISRLRVRLLEPTSAYARTVRCLVLAA